MSMISGSFWSGVADVMPRTGNNLLEGATGAYVGVVGLAPSEKLFLENAVSALRALGFDLIEMEDVEFIESVERWSSADAASREKAANLTESNKIEVATFHCYWD